MAKHELSRLRKEAVALGWQVKSIKDGERWTHPDTPKVVTVHESNHSKGINPFFQRKVRAVIQTVSN